MQKIEISIVIPAYNAANTICDVLDSVKNQTRTDYIREVIIVDDGSVDDTAAWVEAWKQENKDMPFEVILFSQPNGGVSKARNEGVRRSKGNYIAFLDSDDVWNETKIEMQCRIIEDYPQIRMLGTGWKDHNRYPGRKIRNKKGYQLYEMTVRSELFKYWPNTSSILVLKSDFLQSGGFDESRRYGEDGDLFCKLAGLRGRIYYTSEELVDCGKGKNTFGESGLSEDIKRMHLGFLQNVRNCYKRGSINLFEGIIFTVWEYIKYFRRNYIVLWRRIRKTL